MIDSLYVLTNYFSRLLLNHRRQHLICGNQLMHNNLINIKTKQQLLNLYLILIHPLDNSLRHFLCIITYCTVIFLFLLVSKSLVAHVVY